MILRRSPFLLASAAALVALGVLLAVSGTGANAHPPRWGALLAAFAALAALASLRRLAPRARIGAVVALVASAALTAAWLAVPVGDGGDAAWEAARRRELEPRIRSLLATVPNLASRADSLLAADGNAADSADDLAVLQRSWRDRVPGGNLFPCELALWVSGERVAWTAGIEPFPLDAGTPGKPAVLQGRDGWYWRGLSGSGDRRLEWQLRLTGPQDAALPAGVTSARIVTATEPERGHWQGNARRGLWYSADIALDSAPEDMELSLLRLTFGAPPRESERGGAAAAARAAVILLWSCASAGAGFALAGLVGLLAALWAGRILGRFVGLVAWWQLALAGPWRDPGPGSLGSLLDPTYFASRWGAGLFDTGVDALLTGALLGATLWIAAHRLLRAAPSGRPGASGGAPSRLAPLGVGIAGALAAAGAVLLLSDLAGALANGANARLIGPKVPLSHVSFWGLHLALLLPSLGFWTLVKAAGTRWRGVRGAGALFLLGAFAAGLVVGRGLPLPERLIGPGLAVLLWWGGRWRPGADDPVRRIAWLLPLLATVCWNYLSLARTYDANESAWLTAKADEIVRPQEDWVRFLMEDLMSETAVAAVDLQAVPASHAPEADDLWQHWAAFVLWRQARIGDLRLPCLLEILDDDGESLSRFASGFFREQGYEIVERSDWETGRPVVLGPGRTENLFLQTERRRYAAGDERIMRGEVERPGGGWISLELPVQSFRSETLLARLTGQGLDAAFGAYAPRQEVDQPLLLMRADARGWRDTGGAAVPEAGSDRTLARLRSGEAQWGIVRASGQRYRCQWRDLDDTGEGFLLGIRVPSLGDRLLDLSRLMLLDLMLLGAIGVVVLLGRVLLRPGRGLGLGFQERYLAVSLVLGLLPLLLAGTFIDRLSREWLADGARAVAREGTAAAEEQLQGLLAEQARALAGSDYIADLLASRLAGNRPLGPFAQRQAMIFSADGDLLLDETLSDLDPDEARLLLDQARSSSLVLMRDGRDVYLGTLIPVDLAPGVDATDTDGASDLGEPVARRREGWFFYRQRVDTDLMASLGDVIQGEATLYASGEALLASHPEQVFTGRTPLVLSARTAERLRRQPGNIHVQPTPGRPHAWTGMLTLPSLDSDEAAGKLALGRVPAVLTVTFTARARDFAGQRERTVLFLAGLATLIFLTAALLALVLTWKIFDPVRVLVDATRRLAGGDFEAPLPEPGHDEVGTLSASFAAMRDDLRVAQRTLAARERFLARLLEGVPVGVAVFDADDRVVAVNPAAGAIAGAFFGAGPVGDATERGETAETAAAERARRLLAGFREEVAGPVGEAELSSPDGRRTLHGRIAPLDMPEERRHAMLVFEDVTEFLENQRLALNAQLARQVAHEVKNPLTPIQLSIQFLQQAWRDRADNMDDLMERTVRQVLEQVELLRSIATEFSLLGRPEELACTPLSLPRLVAEVVDRYRLPGADVLHVRGLDPDAPVPPVLGHAESLAKVLANLMENSLQAVGNGKVAVEIGWRVEPATVTLLWSDDGPGLSPEVADRLFDPYFSTKSRGTGLGLPICRNLLSRMNGAITLANRPDGNGALAEVTLPRAAGDGADDPGPDRDPRS